MGSTKLNPMHEHPIGDRRYSKALHGHENDEPGHTHAAGSEHGYRDEDLGPGREYQPPSMEELRARAEIDVELSGVGYMLDGAGDDPRMAAVTGEVDHD